MATHSSIPAREISWTEEPRGLQSIESQSWTRLQCSGFSCCGTQDLERAGFSSCGSQALDHRLSSCGMWAQLLQGLGDPSQLGIKPVEPMVPTLAGGFFTTEPPWKPHTFWFLNGNNLAKKLSLPCFLF